MDKFRPQTQLTRRQLLRVAAASGAATWLASCAPATAPAGATTAATGASAAPSSVALRIATNDFVDENFDPVATSQNLDIFLSTMFENPLRIDENAHIAPGIVDKWEVSKDGTSWTLHMRGDVVFHDGTKVTSEDLAYAYKRAASDESYEKRTWQDLLGKNLKIEIVDPQTIIVRTNGPQTLFLPLSTEFGAAIWLLPKALIEKNGIAAFKKSPVGTGPYQFVKHVAGDRMEFKRVSYKHWRIAPQFTDLTILLVPSAATGVSMLKTGAIDEIEVTAEDAKALQGAGYKIQKGVEVMIYCPIVGAEHPNNKGKPLADVRVRKAMSLAVDRQQIINTLLPNNGSLPGPIRVGYNMPDMTDALRKKWSDWSKENYKYDVAAAKKLLADAGFPNGFTFDFWNVPDTGTPFLSDMVQVLAGYWDKVGIKANITNVDNGFWKANRSTQASAAGIGKMAIMNSSMTKASAVENVGSVFGTNKAMDALVGTTDQAKFDKIYAEAKTTLDQATQERDLDQMIEIAASSWIEIPICYVSILQAFSPRVDPVITTPTLNIGDRLAYWKYTGK
jgi:peptide/nickel transport system substrate-binding protein